MDKRNLKSIIKESIRTVLKESNQQLPWFISEFIQDFGVYFDDSVVSDPKNIRRFKVQFIGGKRYNGYKFTKIRVVFTGGVSTWAEDLNPHEAYQMVYSLPARRILPSKQSTSDKNIRLSYEFLEKYTKQCEALGIEVIPSWDRKYSRAPFALHY